MNKIAKRLIETRRKTAERDQAAMLAGIGGVLGPLPSGLGAALGAEKGKRMRTGLGAGLGNLGGLALGSATRSPLAVYTLGGWGGALGAYAAHGKSKKRMKKKASVDFSKLAHALAEFRKEAPQFVGGTT